MNKLTIALAALVSSVSIFGGSRADAQIVMAPITGLSLGTSIPVGCVNSGGSQDVLKTPSIKNDTGKTIPAGKTISWKSSDGDHGTVKLSADLAPGASLKVQGTKPGNAYSCSGFFFASPDLAPTKGLYSPSAATVSISIANRDAFVGAASSVARVELYSCSGTLLGTTKSAPFTLGAGETKSFTLTMPSKTGKTYLKVFADDAKQVAESNEQNNILDTMNACLQ